MKAGEVVRVDVGCQVDHYMGDVGRTAPVSGTFTAGQREAWDLFIASLPYTAREIEAAMKQASPRRDRPQP